MISGVKMDTYTLSVIGFFLIVAAFIYFDRKKIEHSYFVLFMRRTKRFGDLINSITNISPKTWKVFYTIGILIGILAMIYGIIMITSVSSAILSGQIDQAAAKLILPSFSAEESIGEYSVNIPFWTWILVIALILVPHELSHGIAARADKVRLKSVGLMLLAIFPGAFVEPDEKQLARKPLMTRLRVFCAGTYMNFIVAGIAILLLSFIVFPLMFQPGVQLQAVDADSPAELAGLTNQTILTHINSIPITITYSELVQQNYFADEIGEVVAGQEIQFTDSEGNNYNIVLEEKNSSSYMGILYAPIPTKDPLYAAIADFLTKLWMFSFAVAIFNMLPIGPLDGGLVFQSLTDKYIGGPSAKKIQKWASMISLILVIFMFFGANIMGLI